ncbi:hypothetical protein EVG20_g2019 [Dentipellis fragilis]|uniref:Protoporphyrinogen oxidase n=1 Tax=Dentipellis fragilis TaxID=205917 RepID=A0A4Y9ZB03_9AGAM|nr:hypothetical protein EVG20_g2019 [Dentipellis fragilis]
MSSATPHIAILGGGVTGLSAAFHLARLHPNARITLLEKQPRLGGWLRSERVEVEDVDGRKASILLETGPRTFRANAKPVVELVNLLKLQSHVVTALRSSPAARNRFLHVSPTPGLQALPSSVLSLFTSPLSSLLLGAVVKETFGVANRPEGLQDESVDAFFTRRFGEQFARVMGSALVHGIYGADSRKLSVRAAFPSMWAAEEVGRGSVVWGEMGPPDRRAGPSALPVAPDAPLPSPPSRTTSDASPDLPPPPLVTPHCYSASRHVILRVPGHALNGLADTATVSHHH